MDLKTGMLVMLIGITIVGMTLSQASAYEYYVFCGNTDDYLWVDTYDDENGYSSCDITYQSQYPGWWYWTYSSSAGGEDQYYTYSDPDDRDTEGYAYNEYLNKKAECSKSESGGMWAFAGKNLCGEQVVDAVCW